jgi:pyridoxal phosphate enzyme (YggS family)
MSYSEIAERVQTACHSAKRDPDSVQLIAVSKVQPNDRVKSVLDAGHQVFGENRVQEAAGKWPDFRESYNGVKLHLIGPLQTNKARQAFTLFDTIQSVDRPKLARSMAQLSQEFGYCPELFVQVNTGEEAQKAGVLPADLDDFITECRSMDLNISGLMCIPPVDQEPSLHFALVSKMADRNGLMAKSMGMSADFESAIALGATHIRVGSAIFGTRTTQQ